MILNKPAGEGAAGLTAVVFNIMRFATHDGPGIRTTVFFKGCPLSCWWCHNPESQSFHPDILYFAERCRQCGECVAACPEHGLQLSADGRSPAPVAGAACRHCGACAEACPSEARQLAGRRMPVDEIVNEVERDLIFFEESGGGITLSGGEPLAQPETAAAILRECRARGIHTVLETCGYAKPETFRYVTSLAGLVLFDVKFISAAAHLEYTGKSNAPILRNLEELMDRGLQAMVRIPIIPGINDTAMEIESLAGYLGRFRGCRVELLPYHRTGSAKYARLGWSYRLEDTPEPSAAGLARIGDRLTSAGLKVTVGDQP